MKGRAIHYSAEERAWLEQRRRMPRAELHAAFLAEFGRSDVALMHIKSFCTRQGWRTGRSGRFDAGIVPHNKGKTMPYNANSAATRFAQGNLPHNTKWLGHERVSKDGYAEISIAETNPHTGFGRRYVLKHRYLWTRANGPVPAGMALKCLDGNRLNTDPSNWRPVPRALLPRLNGKSGRDYDHAEAALQPTILAVATLEHAAAKTRRRARSST